MTDKEEKTEECATEDTSEDENVSDSGNAQPPASERIFLTCLHDLSKSYWQVKRTQP